jgi:hypothetical protein
MKYRTDDIALLLSTDWFLQVWGECGLQSPVEAAVAMKKECRSIVQGFVGENDSFWDVEYSLPRMKETEHQLINAMRVSRLIASDQEVFSDLIHGNTARRDTHGDASLILNLLNMLVADAERDKEMLDGITPTMLAKVKVELGRSTDYSGIVAQLHSEWDKWVASITSEIPELLTNVARDVHDYNGPVGTLWGRLRSSMTDLEMASLEQWLNHWGQYLAGRLAVNPK